MRISDWSSDVCSSDLARCHILPKPHADFTQSALLWRAYDRVGKFDLGQMECGPGAFHSGFQTRASHGHGPDLLACDGLLRLCLCNGGLGLPERSEEHTSELQSLMRISYAVFCL